MFRPSRLTPTTRCTACAWVSPSSTWPLRNMWANDTRWCCRYGVCFMQLLSALQSHPVVCSTCSTCMCLGFLLPVAVRGAAWRVPREHVQPGQSAAPDGPHTFGHTLLPEGAYTPCTETGGLYAYDNQTSVFIVTFIQKWNYIHSYFAAL